MDEAGLGRGMAGVAPINQREHSTAINIRQETFAKRPFLSLNWNDQHNPFIYSVCR